ncbi:MAG: hypothetical protein ACKO2K_00450 [Alphaproteobacteria bacterium]
MTSAPEPTPGWTRLGSAGLDARALLVARKDIAFWKHVFESHEGVAILRTIETLDRDRTVVALLATPDWTAVASEILASIEESGSPPFSPEPLPPVCHEDWFLATWVREDD